MCLLGNEFIAIRQINNIKKYNNENSRRPMKKKTGIIFLMNHFCVS